MARSIFIKYNLNDYQGKLLKNQNEPNPVFYKSWPIYYPILFGTGVTSYRNIKSFKEI